jgi:NADH-quinone oxidoreductase subunit E
MLTIEERREIEEKFTQYPTKQAICIDAMLIVQRRQGWVSDESMRDLSELLGLSVADLDGVATFYNLIRRKPVGRHVAHGRFTLLPIVCLGACDHAPAMMIDGKLYEDLDVGRIEEVLTHYD